MNLNALKSKLSMLEEALRSEKASHFTLTRDIDCNLHIHHAANDIQLPLVPFRDYQLEVQQALFRDGVKRFFLVRPRRAGKEVESWNLLIQAAIERPGLYFMIYPSNVRARAVLWDGAIMDMENDISIPFRDMIPKEMLPKFNEQEMKVKLRANGSVIQCLGSDMAIDKLRGTNPLGIVMSEFAYADPRVYHVLDPILVQNGGWIILQSTFNGMNHAYHLMEQVKLDPSWYCRVDSVETLVNKAGERYVTDEMVNQSRRNGMPEFMVLQEYYSIVQLNQQSMYFATEINAAYETNRIRQFSPLPDKPVYAAWDLGWNDTNPLSLFQLDDNQNPHFIYYFENSNKGIRWYVDEARQWCNRMGLMLKAHFLPHDGKNHSRQTTLSDVEFGKQLGENFISVPRPANHVIAIDLMRRMLYRSTFDGDNCKRLIECLSNYTKEFDEKMNVWKEQPRHDWASHGVKSFQTAALAIENKLIPDQRAPIFYYNQRK